MIRRVEGKNIDLKSIKYRFEMTYIVFQLFDFANEDVPEWHYVENADLFKH